MILHSPTYLIIKMSELNNNAFFEALKAKRDQEEAIKIIEMSKDREDQWWSLYRKGLVKYDNNTTAI